MAYSLIDKEISNTSVGNTSGVNMSSDLPGTHQMNLLAQNFDNMVMNSSANVSMSDTKTDKGRIVVNSSERISSPQSEKNSNIYLSLLLTKHHKKEVTELAEFHKCLNDGSSYMSDCVFCREERLQERLRNSVKLDSFIGNPKNSKITNAKCYKNNYRKIPRLQFDRRKKKVSFRI